MVALAQEEARSLKHGHIGTEHLLLGMLREREGVAARVLESFDVTLERARGEVVRIVGVGQAASSGQLPFTARAKQVLELAPQEARTLGHSYIDPEHVLLALTTLPDGTARRILGEHHVEPVRIRGELLRIVEPPPEAVQTATPAQAPPSDNGFEEWIRVRPGAGLHRLLMFAAARALDEGREDIQPRDILLALTRDEQAGPLLAELGVDDLAIRRALDRRRPREASTEG